MGRKLLPNKVEMDVNANFTTYLGGFLKKVAQN